MALFSLLVAIIVERLKLLPARWQLDSGLRWYQKQMFTDSQLGTVGGMILALLLPAVTVAVALWVVNGWFWGLPSLLLWVALAVVCFSHQYQRRLFKRYVQAACRGDVQASFHFAGELDCSECLDAVSERELGCRVGQSVAWLNYRYYGAVALFLILFGPVGAVFYCSVRFFDERRQRLGKEWPVVHTLLYWLDWLPARIIGFGYVLCGHFSNAFPRWCQLALSLDSKPRDIVTEVALAAETLPEDEDVPVSVQSTLALLALSKRNSTLLITILSLLTIFGLVS
ncbi:beta-lactamase regulator AmpE [Shewanella algae]|uniref:beta-lactamase regulator AmpE n=1 Tax=Shewanella algae TaxID=38313 RepID=UPI001AAD2A36|nr:beta-lactamase regulator AmpE [Shewanella algae]QTE87018.1 beta-lactamase regulator AmpE [Shewanella algae]